MVTDILQPTHLLFILVVALLVLGPKRLPEVARTLGNGLRDFRSAISGDDDERPGRPGHYALSENEETRSSYVPQASDAPVGAAAAATAVREPAPPTEERSVPVEHSHDTAEHEHHPAEHAPAPADHAPAPADHTSGSAEHAPAPADHAPAPTHGSSDSPPA